ncbi:MAG: signal recognition particle protein, partial [Alphaproteobacteria bacterium]|nr:signal recognition particle protein [Alphaproteobacteria bacterium]
MFDQLGTKLGAVFDKLRGRGVITEADVDTALREVRLALLEADVALQVVKDFIAAVRFEAIGQQVVRSVTPGQMVVKIVHDKLIETLGSTATDVNLRAAAPIPFLMLGLQGSGKTTTSAKLAKRLTEKDRKKVLLASLDTRRPAAQEQLAVLGTQIGVTTLPIVAGQEPVAIAKRAMEVGRTEGYDVVILDTAGRLSIDEELMAEAKAVRDTVQPAESLLVVDALTGQDALTTATRFNEGLGITGVVMTRLDGDQRGGAALSMRAVTGKPIKLVGLGEKMDALETFHPDRVAGRILGMGDIVGLVEKAAETIDAEKAAKAAARMQKGEFDLDDLAEQLRQMKNMGGLSGLLGMMPGVGKMKNQLAAAGL